MKIRRASVTDKEAIAALTAELGYQSDPMSIEERLSLLTLSPHDAVFVAELQGIVVGWIQASLSTLLESGKRLEIVGLIVARAYRKASIGKALVAEVESWGASEGVPHFSVRTNIKREDANQFYPRLGYILAKTQNVYRKSITQSTSTR